MTRIRALAVICLLLVLVSGPVSGALGDASRSVEETSKQIAVPNEPDSSPSVQVLPKEPLTLRDQSTTFFVRIEDADESGGVLLCLSADTAGDAEFEFHSNDVKSPPVLEMVCPEADEQGYIPASEVGEVESIPISLSSDENFPIGTNEATVETQLKSSLQNEETKFTFQVACPIDCRIILLWQWTLQNLDLIIAALSLLIAFLGRKKIWAVLRAPRRHVANTAGGERRREPEEDHD